LRVFGVDVFKEFVPNLLTDHFGWLMFPRYFTSAGGYGKFYVCGGYSRRSRKVNGSKVVKLSSPVVAHYQGCLESPNIFRFLLPMRFRYYEIGYSQFRYELDPPLVGHYRLFSLLSVELVGRDGYDKHSFRHFPAPFQQF
jgi:hypothetical protein